MLPSCQVCYTLTFNRNRGICVYPSAAPSSVASSSLSSTPVDQLQIEQQPFPSVFFLDKEMFHQAQLELPRPGLTVPLYISDLLGGDDKVRQNATTFFTNIHPWMPFISKTWAYKNLLSPLSPVHADSTLLLLSIQLINWVPSKATTPKTPIYLAAKRFLLELETAGLCTLRMLQARLLIGLYELGHCIYPAAFMTAGACARHGVLLGIDKDIKQSNVTDVSQDRVEERKRVWWAVLILDR